MKALLAAALLLLAACSPAGTDSATRSPEARGRRQVETTTSPTDTAASGTFGGGHEAPEHTATSGTHPGATGTDASTLTDPNVSTTDPRPARTDGAAPQGTTTR